MSKESIFFIIILNKVALGAGGNWSNPSSWPSGNVPTDEDDVFIPANTNITLDVA